MNVFLWKLLKNCFWPCHMLICLYLLNGNVLTTPCLLCLLYVSCVAFCCALCIFEKLDRLYICFDMHFSWKQGEELHIPWFMHCQQGGEYVWKGRSCMHFGRFCGKLVCICEMLHVRRKIEKKRLHLLRGSLHMCRGSSFDFPEFCAVCGVLLVSFVLSRLCWAVTLALGGRDLVWQVILFSLVL